jgi:hypothetical protein
MRICDPCVGIVRDGHEPNDAEEQRPRGVPIEPVHVISPRKDRREQEAYQHSAKASRGFGAFCAAVLSQWRRQPVHLDRPAAALTSVVIRSLSVVDALRNPRVPRLPTSSGGLGSISRPLHRPLWCSRQSSRRSWRILSQSALERMMESHQTSRQVRKCHDRKWLILSNNLTERPPLDGVARLRFVERKLRANILPQ